MEQQELANELRDMYDDGASKDETVAHIILFGIKYAAELAGCSLPTIVELSGVSSNTNYSREIGIGVKLAQYVKLK